MIGLFQMGALAWLLFLSVIAITIAVLYPALRRGLSRLEPMTRTIALRGLRVAPLVGGLGVAFLCFAPKLLGLVVPAVDHCAAHGDGHFHFCLQHPPATAGAPALWWILGVIACAAAVTTLLRWRRFRRSMRTLQQLSATARFSRAHDAWMIETPLPWAVSVGVRQVRTLLSTGLVQSVPAPLVAAVVAHERAHATRRDAWWKIVTALLSLGHFPRTQRALESDLQLACEQACDEHAAAAVGSRVRVAQALLAVARVRQQRRELGPAALAFDAQDLTARVKSLLKTPARRSWPQSVWTLLLVFVAALAAGFADPLHHMTETLIHHVIG